MFFLCQPLFLINCIKKKRLWAVYNRLLSLEACQAYKLSVNNYRRQCEIAKRNYKNNLFYLRHINPKSFYMLQMNFC